MVYCTNKLFTTTHLLAVAQRPPSRYWAFHLVRWNLPHPLGQKWPPFYKWPMVQWCASSRSPKVRGSHFRCTVSQSGGNWIDTWTCSSGRASFISLCTSLSHPFPALFNLANFRTELTVAFPSQHYSLYPPQPIGCLRKDCGRRIPSRPVVHLGKCPHVHSDPSLHP